MSLLPLSKQWLCLLELATECVQVNRAPSVISVHIFSTYRPTYPVYIHPTAYKHTAVINAKCHIYLVNIKYCPQRHDNTKVSSISVAY